MTYNQGDSYKMNGTVKDDITIIKVAEIKKTNNLNQKSIQNPVKHLKKLTH